MWTLVRDSGKVVARFGRSGRSVGQFHWIHNIAVDSKGNIYTGEVFNGELVQLSTRTAVGEVGILARHAPMVARLVPAVVVTIFFGAFQSSENFGDIYAMLGLGLLGWLMKQLAWPRAPFLVGFVLTKPTEQYLWLSISRYGLEFKGEAFNLTNTPHFANPSTANANVSNLQLNADGTIRNLGGFSSITTTANSGRDGIDERLIRFGVRLGF